MRECVVAIGLRKCFTGRFEEQSMVRLFRRRNIVRFRFGCGSLFIAMIWMAGIHFQPAILAADEKNAITDKAGEGDARDLSEEQALKRKAQMAAMERLAG